MRTEIYSAIRFEEGFLDADKEYRIEALAKLLPAHGPDGATPDQHDWDIVEVYCNGKKSDTETIAPQLYWNEQRMPEAVLIQKLLDALSNQ